MNTRLVSKERTGRNKSYTVDPGAGIKLQRAIGHLAEEVKVKLEEVRQPDVAEIIPLD